MYISIYIYMPNGSLSPILGAILAGHMLEAIVRAILLAILKTILVAIFPQWHTHT